MTHGGAEARRGIAQAQCGVLTSELPPPRHFVTSCPARRAAILNARSAVLRPSLSGGGNRGWGWLRRAFAGSNVRRHRLPPPRLLCSHPARPAALHRVGRSPARTCAGTFFETPAHPQAGGELLVGDFKRSILGTSRIPRFRCEVAWQPGRPVSPFSRFPHPPSERKRARDRYRMQGMRARRFARARRFGPCDPPV